MLKVKVCGMTDSRNLSSIADAGPDFLGFIFYPGSPRYNGRAAADSLLSKVPATIEKVGVFVNEEPEEVVSITGILGIRIVQLHGSESSGYCAVIRSSGCRVVKSFGIDMEFDFDDLIPYYDTCDYFLFDTRSVLHGGTGVKFDWNKLSEYQHDKPFFLSGGIRPGDAHEIRGVCHRSLFAIDINSRFETSPGIKDPIAVRSFIREIKKTK